MSITSNRVILPATVAMASRYIALFVNRRTHTLQSGKPNKSGKYFFYKNQVKNPDGTWGPEIPLSPELVSLHLAGKKTVGLYAINPRTNCVKWLAIDADYAGARQDLLRLQSAFRQDGVETLMEQSRRGGHLWMFMNGQVTSRLARLYAGNIAIRLGIAIKQDLEDGIEIFPRHDEIASGDYGSAIRGPIGMHRGARRDADHPGFGPFGTRFWFEDAEPDIEAQLRLVEQVGKVTAEDLGALTQGMSPLPERQKPDDWADRPIRPGVKCFQILEHLERLGFHGRNSGKEIVFECPCCRRKPLNVNRQEPTRYKCWHGCTSDQIRDALGAPKNRSTVAA